MCVLPQSCLDGLPIHCVTELRDDIELLAALFALLPVLQSLQCRGNDLPDAVSIMPSATKFLRKEIQMSTTLL